MNVTTNCLALGRDWQAIEACGTDSCKTTADCTILSESVRPSHYRRRHPHAAHASPLPEAISLPLHPVFTTWFVYAVTVGSRKIPKQKTQKSAEEEIQKCLNGHSHHVCPHRLTYTIHTYFCTLLRPSRAHARTRTHADLLFCADERAKLSEEQKKELSTQVKKTKLRRSCYWPSLYNSTSFALFVVC